MCKILNNNIKFELLPLNHDKELDYVSNPKKTNVLNDLNDKEEI